MASLILVGIERSRMSCLLLVPPGLSTLLEPLCGPIKNSLSTDVLYNPCGASRKRCFCSILARYPRTLSLSFVDQVPKGEVPRDRVCLQGVERINRAFLIPNDRVFP